jgi:primosomal protein N'
VGASNVGDVESDRPVIVGTERDLAGLSRLDLAVAVDVDALLFGQNYRSSEEALRILARLVGSVQRGKGSRTILQTSSPEAPLLAALRRGQPLPYLEMTLGERARNGFPPATEMMALEVRDEGLELATSLLEDLAGNMILGRVETERGLRWLIQGDLGAIRPGLRVAAQKLRDSGATVRIDVDPIDL